MLCNKYHLVDPSESDAAYELFRGEINALARCGAWSRAREAALEWAAWTCADLRLSKTSNWKVFKRRLIAKWFGAPEKRIFNPPWNAEEIIQYGIAMRPKTVRISSFPQGIACHAHSERLTPQHQDQWSRIICTMDPHSLIEAFPESSTPTSICFRRTSGAFGEDTRYEVSNGQAMTAFESEQGKHPVVTAFYQRNSTHPEYMYPLGFPDATVDAITRKLVHLIDTHGIAIESKCKMLCYKVGIPWLGIEGYFDPKSDLRLTIVDVDLPFDFVFMTT